MLLLMITILLIYLFIGVQKEKRRNRILQSFMAGIIKRISDYVSQTDLRDIICADDVGKKFSNQFPIPYKEVLDNINHEFSKDFWIQPYWKWIKAGRNLFYENKYANDGFDMIYWEFYDKAIAEMEKESKKNTKDLSTAPKQKKIR